MLTSKDLYDKAVEMKLEIGNWQSDLHIKDTEDATKLIKEYEYSASVTKFKSNIDGSWWYDIPFAYSETWKRIAEDVLCKS